MKNRSEPPDLWEAMQEKLAGLGETSVRKTYYPALQQRMQELERLRTFLDNSNDAIFLVEVPSGVIVDVNESATRRMGWERNEFLDISLFDISELEKSPEGEALIRVSGQAGKARALTETLLRTKSGGSFPAELTLNRMQFRDKDYVLAVARDVTERKEAEKALRQSENFLKNVVQNIPAMVFAKDAEELRFVVVNHAAEELLGYASKEILGKNDYDLFPAEQADLFTQNDRLTLERGELLEIPEEGIKNRSGKDLVLHTKKIPLYDEAGKVRHLLGISEDITERKRLEEQLLQSQKMEAVGELAGGVAHDFNNILMVIMGFSEMLISDAQLAEPQKAKVGQILEAAHKAAQLTSSLLAFSRKQVMKLRVTDLNDIILHVQKFLSRIIGENIRLRTSIGKGDLMVNVDAGQIEQVLVNLATNARDAMPKGGDLTIESGLQMVDHLFVDVNGLGEPGPYAVISISDTGVGMDERMRQKIFEPFFTTKEPGKGTGLGLSIVYGIIKQHRGFVNVYSEPGLGTTFRIYLPLAAGAVAAPEVAADKQPVRGGGETIMVAEDDAILRQLLESILADYGYRVVLASDGAEAVEKYREAGKVDLVLMDMIMPRLSGKEACDAIRKINPEVRVLYTSGYTRDFMLTRELLDESTELVMKPVQPQELLKKVRELLDRNHAHENEPPK